MCNKLFLDLLRTPVGICRLAGEKSSGKSHSGHKVAQFCTDQHSSCPRRLYCLGIQDHSHTLPLRLEKGLE